MQPISKAMDAYPENHGSPLHYPTQLSTKCDVVDVLRQRYPPVDDVSAQVQIIDRLSAMRPTARRSSRAWTGMLVFALLAVVIVMKRRKR